MNHCRRAASLVLGLMLLAMPCAALAGRIGGDITVSGGGNDPTVLMQRGDALYYGDGVAADRQAALAYYERAADLGDLRAHLMVSFIYREKLDPAALARALAIMERAVALCATPDRDPLCATPEPWKEQSAVLATMFRFSEALVAARKALAVAEAAPTPDPVVIAQIHQDIGSHYTRIGKLEDALSELQQAVSTLEAKLPPDDLRIGFALSDLGMAYQHLNRGQEAVAAERRAAAILARQLGEGAGPVGALHNNIGWALKDLQRYDEAFSEFETAARIIAGSYGPQAAELAYPISNMGIIRERQGRHDEAIPLNMKALVIETRFRAAMLEPLRWTQQSLSRSWKAKGRPERAILFAKLAVNAHQEIRQRNRGLDEGAAAALAADWRNVYDELADLLVGEGRITEAQYVLDLQKQQELIEFVRGEADAAAAAALSPRETEVDAAIAAAMQRPIALAAELDGLARKQQASPLSPEESSRMAELNAQLDDSYASFMTDVETLLTRSEQASAAAQADVASLNLDYAADRQEMLRQFATPTVLLQAASLDDGLHLFLTTKDISVHRAVDVSRADLSRKVLEALEAIAARSPDADARLAGLYDLLVKPLEGDLRQSGARVVMLNLGGFLRYVPFAALKSGHGYLIEDYALALDTPAAKTRYGAPDRSTASAAGFGVTEGTAGFTALPGVAAELEAIFKGQDAQGELDGAPRLDAEFTEESLRQTLVARPALLHVASHFKFVPGNETKSFLLLGNGAELSLAKIRKGRGFRFGGVDLLTLSACETAKGSDAQGDEVESFGAIAQMNGASAVMATLWPIADATSGRLMADFYAGLIDTGLDKAQALRRAQIAMLRGVAATGVDLTQRGASGLEEEAAPASGGGPVTDPRHPYYWSPYILMGNWL
jgi:CHAT domain-containing protein/tetratricopeptide (TPR) repeat protein